MSTRSRLRGISTFVAVIAALGVLFGACIDTRRSNGEDCLKDDDCLSGICSVLKCVGNPPLLDGSAGSGDTGGGGDSSPDTAAEGGDSSTTDSGDSGDADGPQ